MDSFLHVLTEKMEKHTPIKTKSTKTLRKSIKIRNKIYKQHCKEKDQAKKELLHKQFKIYRYSFPAGIYLLKVNNRNTRTRCEICSKLTINTPERRHWRRSGVFIVNFEHISHLVLVFLLLTLNK